ncbi:hypothetical protein GCM10009754_07470 [Amycolatopsis minnesotensis]|uniref:Uncharacterized protein n=1 Tax=Amycolatopsis minnesotensis TaxID=337894 RepID=A0ABN2Q5D3_9PSEU
MRDGRREPGARGQREDQPPVRGARHADDPRLGGEIGERDPARARQRVPGRGQQVVRVVEERARVQPGIAGRRPVGRGHRDDELGGAGEHQVEAFRRLGFAEADDERGPSFAQPCHRGSQQR